jgi:alpha-ribazole phosphatase
VGRSEWPVDPRKAKRLAHRVRQQARRLGLERVVLTSPRQRCADVGRWLRRWGWQHRTDAALAEMDFGAWDGQLWRDIGPAPVDAWCADFAHHAPGGGESLAAFLRRVAAWQAPAAVCVVGHGGWLRARRWLAECGGRLPMAHEWGGTPAYGAAFEDFFFEPSLPPA